jgi:hypothetical protein
MKGCRLVALLAITMAVAGSCLSWDHEDPGDSLMPAARAGEPNASGSGAVWVVDPTVPGPDVPPAGRSLFDFLVTERQGDRLVSNVPFPFAALIQRIERELGQSESGSSLKRVLIPLNRSLQRHAAAPAFFSFPRAVVGVDGEPPPRAGFSGLFLKDRLFLGYQEKAEILEVISYNEAAGRFEFQVVRDYGPGKAPRVSYANRTLCTACHQNHGPIFSRPLWEETNANPAVARLLEDQHGEFYRFPVRVGIDVPDALDRSTDRANELSAYQLIWQEGCERPRSPAASIHCRADLFRLLLLSRLTGLPLVLRQVPWYRERFLPHAVSRWNDKWPDGIKIPNPDLLNRNPFDFEPRMARSPTMPGIQAERFGAGERAKIRSIFEPTIPREPLAVWSFSAENGDAVDRVVMGLSGFLAEVDIARLDEHLFRLAARLEIPRRRYRGRCEGEVRKPGRSADRLTFHCSGTTNEAGPGDLVMEGVLYLNKGTVTGGTIERLSTGEGDEPTGWHVAGGKVTTRGGRYDVRMLLRQNRGLHARLADGDTITEATLDLGVARNGRIDRETAGLTGTAAIEVAQDYAAVQRAVDAMVRDTLLGESDVLARQPFRRASVMKALFRHLQMPALDWCCEGADEMPAPRVMADHLVHHHDAEVLDDALPPAVKAFHRYCGQCHHEDLAFPPNFLHGSPQEALRRIEACAERIVFRLEMWGVPPSARPEAPMPPATALPQLRLTPEQWAGYADLALLKSYAADLAGSGKGQSVRLADLAAKGYDNLRACTPPPGSAMAAQSGAARE